MKEILYLLHVDVAYAVKLQCGREYGLADDSQLPKATQLDKLTEEELFGCPQTIWAEKGIFINSVISLKRQSSETTGFRQRVSEMKFLHKK